MTRYPTVRKHVYWGCAALLMSAAVASADDVRGGACGTFPVAEPAVSPARLASEIRRAEDDLARVGRALGQMGCGGSVIIIRGGEGNVCAGLEAERAALEDRLAGQRAAERRWKAGEPARDFAKACAGSPEEPQRASYSQFRRPFGRGAIIELRPDEKPGKGVQVPWPVAHSEAEPEPAGPQPLPGPPVEEEETGELIDLADRLAERDVRVVGPKFLPDRSEAIDLRSPVPTFFP